MPDPTPDLPSGQESPADPQSALLILVPAAEPVVGAYRARLDAGARDGVPAHLTVLYPFLRPALIDDAVLTSLAVLFGASPVFTFSLDRVGWFGDEVGTRGASPGRWRMTAAFPLAGADGGR
jgi:hypothetical protein